VHEKSLALGLVAATPQETHRPTVQRLLAGAFRPNGWVIWLVLLIRVIGDIFRSSMSGFGKAAWLVFVIVLPFLGVLIYLIAHGTDMGERDVAEHRAAKASFDDYVRSVASTEGAAAELAKAKQLLDSGAITAAEFDAIKAKAVA
jgi:hypothetical protein